MTTSAWRPIETAPTDGTLVLLYGPKSLQGGKVVDKHLVTADRYAQPNDRKGFIGWGKFNAEYWPPTHWMPLPDPPPAETE